MNGARIPPAVRTRLRPAVMRAAIGLAALAAAAFALSASAEARILRPWGSTLSATPTLDTANGASNASRDQSVRHGVNPDPHDGADLVLWNRQLGRGLPTAPRGGQVLAIRIKGCALEDHSAPSQLSAGIPVNQINFQALAPSSGGYRATATATGFHLPFCSNSARPARGRVNTSTITTFHPIHLCVAKGYAVGFYDIGGFIPNPRGPSWYPEGVPFEIIARVGRSSMGSFADADASGGTYLSGGRPRGANSGWATEGAEQLMLQVVEGTGGDAYGLCPGGTADEPLTSNRIICAYHAPFDRHRPCGRAADLARKTSVSG